MKSEAILHRSRGLDCFALSAYRFRIRLRTARNDFDEVSVCFTLNKYAWQSERKTEVMRKWLSDARYDYYSLDISGSDNRLAYLFILRKNKKTYYFSEEGLTARYDFEKAYMTFFQYPFVHTCDVHVPVTWADRAVMYQIFPDRFFNGTGAKPYINTAWEEKPTPRSFFGGDLAGIESKLDYLQDLGVNCLYLTPVFPSVSNHKYDISDYFDVDPMFGGKEALRSLTNALHARGMRLILDGVFNHCSWDHPFFKDAEARGKASPYHDWFFIDGECPDREKINYLTFGSVRYMPKWNTGCPEVIDYLTGVGAYWVREFQIDGWRLDVMDEVSEAFLRAFRSRVKQENPDALIIGELWHEPEYCLRGDMLDGVMNYGLTKACMDYLVSRSLTAEGMRDRLCMLLCRCTAPASRMMMNLLDCHDTDRFLTLLKGDRKRMKLALCILFFFVGIPCVYYGDEIGMEGGYDPDCRRGFLWDEAKWHIELREHIKMLSSLRTSGALGGDDISIRADERVLCIQRSRLRLWINASDEPAAYDTGVLEPLGFQIEETEA